MNSTLSQQQKRVETIEQDAFSALLKKEFRPKTDQAHAAVELAVDITAFYRDLGNVEQAHAWLALAREGYGPGANAHTEFLAGTVHYHADERGQAFAVFDALYRQYKKRPFQGYSPDYLNFYLQQAKARDAS